MYLLKEWESRLVDGNPHQDGNHGIFRSFSPQSSKWCFTKIHQVKNVGFLAGFWGCTLQIYTNTCTSRKMVCILTSYVQVNRIYRDAKIQVSKHTTMQRSTYIHFTKIHIRIHTISNYWTIWILIPIHWNLPKNPTKRGSSVFTYLLKTTYPPSGSPGPMWSFRFPGWPEGHIYENPTRTTISPEVRTSSSPAGPSFVAPSQLGT